MDDCSIIDVEEAEEQQQQQPPLVDNALVELRRNMEDNKFDDFRLNLDKIKLGQTFAKNWEAVSGPENKTILELALEKTSEGCYAYELLKAGVKYNYNYQTGKAPIHIAAEKGRPDLLQLLLDNNDSECGDSSNNSNNNNSNCPIVDINQSDGDGMTAFQLLLARLLCLTNCETTDEATVAEQWKESLQGWTKDDLATAAKEGKKERETEEEIATAQKMGRWLPWKLNDTERYSADTELAMADTLQCIEILLGREDFIIAATVGAPAFDTHGEMSSKMFDMCSVIGDATHLQVFCSLQQFNFKAIPEKMHATLARIVNKLLLQQPNLPLLEMQDSMERAARRGYYDVFEEFMKDGKVNFTAKEKEEKLSILHIILSYGLMDTLIHGESSEIGKIKIIQKLFPEGGSGGGGTIEDMRSIINDKDKYFNTALHYAKSYSSQTIAKILLANGAKIYSNKSGTMNVQGKTLGEHLFAKCIAPAKDKKNFDDKSFGMTVDYSLFQRGDDDIRDKDDKQQQQQQHQQQQQQKQQSAELYMKKAAPKRRALVDTELLGWLSEEQELLENPVVISFLEMTFDSVLRRFWIEFLWYLVAAIPICGFQIYRYGNPMDFTTDNGWFVLTLFAVGLLVIGELYKMHNFYKAVKGKKHHRNIRNNLQKYLIDWTVIILVILTLFSPGQRSHIIWFRHIAALTLLGVGLQLFVRFVRVFPFSMIPMHVNMFYTVCKSYAIILFSYCVYIINFAGCFYLMFHQDNIDGVSIGAFGNDPGETVTDDELKTQLLYDSFLHSLAKTVISFTGEINFSDLYLKYWLGYILLMLFVFLVVIVIMNILNGLAVDDIGNIKKEATTYHLKSIIHSLASMVELPLVATKLKVYPNMKPQRSYIKRVSLFGFTLNLPMLSIEKMIIATPEEDDLQYIPMKVSTVKSLKDLKFKEKQQSVADSLAEMKEKLAALEEGMRKFAGLEDGIKKLQASIDRLGSCKI